MGLDAAKPLHARYRERRLFDRLQEMRLRGLPHEIGDVLHAYPVSGVDYPDAYHETGDGVEPAKSDFRPDETDEGGKGDDHVHEGVYRRGVQGRAVEHLADPPEVPGHDTLCYHGDDRHGERKCPDLRARALHYPLHGRPYDLETENTGEHGYYEARYGLCPAVAERVPLVRLCIGYPDADADGDGRGYVVKRVEGVGNEGDRARGEACRELQRKEARVAHDIYKSSPESYRVHSGSMDARQNRADPLTVAHLLAHPVKILARDDVEALGPRERHVVVRPARCVELGHEPFGGHDLFKPLQVLLGPYDVLNGRAEYRARLQRLYGKLRIYYREPREPQGPLGLVAKGAGPVRVVIEVPGVPYDAVLSHQVLLYARDDLQGLAVGYNIIRPYKAQLGKVHRARGGLGGQEALKRASPLLYELLRHRQVVVYGDVALVLVMVVTVVVPHGKAGQHG